MTRYEQRLRALERRSPLGSDPEFQELLDDMTTEELEALAAQMMSPEEAARVDAWLASLSDEDVRRVVRGELDWPDGVLS